MEVDLEGNLREVRRRIEKAAAKSRRDAGEIKLVAVSKRVSAERIIGASKYGVNTFGENYAQELRDKIKTINNNASGLGVLSQATMIHWHFIGRLQKNKVKYIVGNVGLIHSLDSLSLAREINRRAESLGITVQSLIEVNTAGEETKGGVKLQELEGFMMELEGLSSIELVGLMTMAPYSTDPEEARRSFRRLREAKNGLLNEYPNLKELSMGMSDDFEVAIEEGATIVRVGSAIFGQRSY